MHFQQLFFDNTHTIVVDGRWTVESTVIENSTVHHERCTCAENQLDEASFLATVTQSWWTVDTTDTVKYLESYKKHCF